MVSGRLPSHAWNRWRYHYPQAAFPYEDLRAENGRAREGSTPSTSCSTPGSSTRTVTGSPRCTTPRRDPDDLLMSIRVTNAGPDTDTVHVLPTAWFRNTWSWDHDAPKPAMARRRGGPAVEMEHPFLGSLELVAGPGPDGTAPVRCSAKTRPTANGCSAWRR